MSSTETRPPRPRVWTAFLALPLLAVAQGIAGTPLSMVAMARLDPAMRKPPFDYAAFSTALKAQLMSGGLLVGTLAIVAVINIAFVAALSAASPVPWRRRISLPSLRIVPLDALLIFVGGWAASSAVTSAARLLGAYDGSMLNVFARGSAAASPLETIAIVIAGALTGGSEELLFRGYIQTRLGERYGVVKAVLITSALFGLWHFDLVQGLFAFLFGLLFGIVAIRRGSITTGLFVHVVNNAIAFGSQHFFGGGDDDSHAVQVASVPIGAIVFVACGAALWFRTRNVTAPSSEARPATEASRQNIPKSVIALGAALAALAAAAPLVLVASLVWQRLSHHPGVERAEALGRAYGADHDEQECVDRALAMNEAGDVRGIPFASGCLERATHTKGFCDDVPSLQRSMDALAWPDEKCAALGHERDVACTSVYVAVPVHCATPTRE